MEDAVCPVEGCQIPVDVVLRSSDQILIGAHKANLDHYSDGFPSADATTDSKDPVDLTEEADTLKLLMQFAHKAQYPDIFDLSEKSLFDLANAAEKYVVHAAIGACSIYIRATHQKYPVKALAYAVEFHYPKIADIAAPMTMCEELSAMKSMVNAEGLFAWLQYKATYLESMNGILYRRKLSTRTWALPLSNFNCSTWDNYFPVVQAAISRPTGDPHLKLYFKRKKGVVAVLSVDVIKLWKSGRKTSSVSSTPSLLSALTCLVVRRNGCPRFAKYLLLSDW